jgi:hypothetical protein
MKQPNAITDRLAACIYFADCDARQRTAVLWGMVPAKDQVWYFRAAERVLRHAAQKDHEATPRYSRSRQRSLLAGVR